MAQSFFFLGAVANQAETNKPFYKGLTVPGYVL